MFNCFDGHPEVFYLDGGCPVCDMRNTHAGITASLEREIEELDTLCDRMAAVNKEMKERCICGKLAD